MPPLSPHSSADAGPHPTEQEWEAAKGRIAELYQRWTATKVMEIMKAEHGFEATLRMYKGRFDKWGIADKNTKGIEYEAMKMIYDEIFRRDGIEVMFSAQRGNATKLYRIADVRKQLARPGTRRRRETNRSVITEGRIEQVLQRKGIKVIYPEPPSNRPPVLRSAADREADLEAATSTDGCSMSLDSDSDMEPVAGSDPLTLARPSCDRSPAYSAHSQSYEQPSDGAKEADLDIASFIEQMDVEQNPEWNIVSWHSTTPPRMLQHPPPSQEPALEDTKAWVSLVLQMCMQPELAGVHRNSARHTFKHMIATANPHILSSLIHVSCVLQGIGAEESYRLILTDCCELIDLERSSTQFFAIPYRYALACEEQNCDAAMELGDQLLFGAQLNQREAQGLSSNFLVCQQFMAQHLLDNRRDVPRAAGILEHCLRESQYLLVKEHSVNVNCLKLLARAYERLQQYELAIQTYQDAAERSQVVFGLSNPYRLTILRDMALLQSRLGRHSEAEDNLRKVYGGRARLLGPGHGATHSALQALQNFLSERGRRTEAIKLEQENRDDYMSDHHWRVLSEKEAQWVNQQGRSHALYWNKPQGMCKYEFIMPKEAYMRTGPQNRSSRL